MTKQGDLFVVLGANTDQVSSSLRIIAFAGTNHHPAGYFTLLATAKRPKESHRFIEDLMIDGRMSLLGDARTIYKLIEDRALGNIYHKPVRLVIDSAEDFVNQDDAYDALTDMRHAGFQLFIGGKENTLLIEKLVFDAQSIHPSNVTIIRPARAPKQVAL